jgi:hypothetical protein
MQNSGVDVTELHQRWFTPTSMLRRPPYLSTLRVTAYQTTDSSSPSDKMQQYERLPFLGLSNVTVLCPCSENIKVFMNFYL